LALFEENKIVDLESVDILKNQEGMKNSFISEVDITFPIINEKYLKDDDSPSYSESFLPNLGKFKPAIKSKFFLNTKKLQSKVNIKRTLITKNSHIVDNLILSHLSTKRKEYSTDRFRYIFERFDKMFVDFKASLKFSSDI